ncbi:MAG TPA: RNA methyltransferase [Candidatus Saccharimonadales bacterium]|nr:RNA methyltransferase [Candidatus Saccharimonadales bacterium]
MRSLMLIAHNIRSTHNVGSLLRTADGLGVQKVYLTGYTPYPQSNSDGRLPHVAQKLHRQIHKTALGAEETVPWEHSADAQAILAQLKRDGYTVAAIEQRTHAIPLPEYAAPDKVALVVGREVEGIEPEVLELCDIVLEIPMFGKKESFNVAQAAAMALYHCRFR